MCEPYDGLTMHAGSFPTCGSGKAPASHGINKDKEDLKHKKVLLGFGKYPYKQYKLASAI